VSLLPIDTVLGVLEVVEVYDFYDGPRLFLSRNRVGLLFLAAWVEDATDRDVWLFVPVSANRVNSVRSGGLDLRSAFTEAEDGFVFRVAVDRSGTGAEVDRIPCLRLPDEFLPTHGEYLHLDTRTLPILHEEFAQDRARQTNRDAVILKVQVPETFRSEAPSLLLGQVIASFQWLVSSVGQALRGSATNRGRLRPEIIRETQLLVTGFAAGSFAVTLESAETPNVVGESLVDAALETVYEIFDARANVENLRPRLAKVMPRAVSTYVALLRNLTSTGTGLDLEWASPLHERGGRVTLSATDVAEIVDVVRRSNLQVPLLITADVRLLGLNVRTLYFEVEDLATGERYTGHVADDAVSDVEHATINAIYEAEIAETVEIVDLAGNEKVSRELKALKPRPVDASLTDGGSPER
jgi:hypothetical protein